MKRTNVERMALLTRNISHGHAKGTRYPWSLEYLTQPSVEASYWIDRVKAGRETLASVLDTINVPPVEIAWLRAEFPQAKGDSALIEYVIEWRAEVARLVSEAMTAG